MTIIWNDTTADLQRRLQEAEDRAIIAESQVVALSKANGWYQRKWHVAQSKLARLEKAHPEIPPKHGSRRRRDEK